jgi:hypothetical protein
MGNLDSMLNPATGIFLGCFCQPHPAKASMMFVSLLESTPAIGLTANLDSSDFR